MSKVIRESGVSFGPFEDEQIFHIEESSIYKQMGQGIKTVEFIYAYNENGIVNLLEAKTSCPNAANKFLDKEHEVSFDNFFDDVTHKVMDSVDILLVSILGRYNAKGEIGLFIRNQCLQNIRLRFILVITSSKADVSWLPAPKAELERRLFSLRKIWGLEIVVLDRNLAKEKGLIAD